MKSIRQIFKDRPELKDEPEVQELIDYCRELETEVFESRQKTTFSFEDQLAVLVREVFKSLIEALDNEKKDDYNCEESLKNLKDYLIDFQRTTGFNLNG